MFTCFSPLYVLLTDTQPVWLAVIVSALLAVSVPLVTYGLQRITNDKRLMGEHKNGWFTNLLLVILLLVSLYMIYRTGVETWERF